MTPPTAALKPHEIIVMGRMVFVDSFGEEHLTILKSRALSHAGYDTLSVGNWELTTKDGLVLEPGAAWILLKDYPLYLNPRAGITA